MIPPLQLLTAYRNGFFPMANRKGDLRWFSPDPRGILPLDRFHAPRRLRRSARARRFELAIDRSFRDVIVACGSRPDPDGNWIDETIVESYCELHRLGFAHSVETWQEGRLAGGLYGVSLRGAFFGESMFSVVSDASKFALAALVDRLGARGFLLLDIQWTTPFLESFGAIEIPREEYLRLLARSLEADCRFVE
jgi:leucyl/phenylalanyl-tRNA--protein transferase